MTTRRAAHPIKCDCPLCLYGGIEWRGRTCSICASHNKCDGHLRAQSLTDFLSPFYVDKGSRGLVDALARECRQWRRKA